MSTQKQPKKIPAEVLRFTQYLQSKNLSPSTQIAYARYVDTYLAWHKKTFEKEALPIAISSSKADILKYLLHLRKHKKQKNITRSNSLIALNHYFTFLQSENLILSNPTTLIKIRGTKRKQLYTMYTFEELVQLTDNYYNHYVQNYNDHHIPKKQREKSHLSKQRNYLMLSFLLHQGLVTSDLQKINIEDINYQKATVQVTGGKKSNDKIVPLHLTQVGALMHYIQNVRPQLVAFQENKETTQLFLNLPEIHKKTSQSTDVAGVIKNLTLQVKNIDAKFINFKQTRASTITHWIKTVGLRKAQYLAGHKYISATEKYIPNDLENLTEDIIKFNPF